MLLASLASLAETMGSLATRQVPKFGSLLLFAGLFTALMLSGSRDLRAEDANGDEPGSAAPADQPANDAADASESVESETPVPPADEAPADAAPADIDPGEPISFYRHIRPILQTQCQGCHQPAKAGGDYVMTAFDQLVAGGVTGIPTIVPGDPDESYLVEVITPFEGDAYMPQDADPLTQAQIDLIRRWISEGAEDDTPAAARQRYDMEHPPIYTRPPVITSLDFAPDGNLLAVAGFHEVLLIRANPSGSGDGSPDDSGQNSGDVGELVGRLVGMAERIESVRFSPDGTRLAVTGGQPGRMGEVQVWDVEKHDLILSLPITFDTVYGGSWSPDGRLISFGGADNSVRAIDAETGEQVLYQGAHDDWVGGTTFSADGSHLVSVSRDTTVKLIEVATQRFVDNITSITPGALTGGVNAVARHPERDEVVIGGADGVVKVYRMHRETDRQIGDDANLIRRMPAMKGRIFDVAVSADGRRIAAASSLDGTGQIDVYSYEFDTSLSDELRAILGKRVADYTDEERQKVEAYHTDGVKRIAQVDVSETGMYAVAFSPDAARVAAAGADGKVRLIETQTGEILATVSPAPLSDEPPRIAKTDAAAAGLDPPDEALEPESLPEGTTLTAVEIEPAEIHLAGQFDYVQLVVTGVLDSGERLDVTRMVEAELSEPVASVSPGGLVAPRAEGQATLTLTLPLQAQSDSPVSATVTVPVSVKRLETEAAVDFIVDVAPAISKLGCNNGMCHGIEGGRNGFELSLRGYDYLSDVRALTDDLASRRINVASPDDSLMLLKSTGAVPHAGGVLTYPGDPYYEILRRWIAGGAELDFDAPRVVSLDVFPRDPVVQRVGQQQQLRVLANYADGQVRDVTRESFIESGDTEIAEAVNETGLVRSLRRGEAPLLVRYEGAYAATTLTVMGDRSGFVWEDPPTYGPIDELVAAKWERMKIQPSPLAGDAEFIRRVYLDLTGLPPSADDVRAFLADDRDTRVKRDELVEKLIGSEDFIEYWTNKWADLLLVNQQFLGDEGARAYRDWIRQHVADNTPYDQFAWKILTATGSNRENPAASYFKALREPDDLMETTTHLFLGVRFNCNKCHDHPFERWTQDQYFELSAYFAHVDLSRDPESGDRQIGGTAVQGARPLYEIVADSRQREITHDRTGEVISPRFPYETDFEVPEEASRRETLAAWVTSPDNEYFASSFVNRLWGYLMGRGLIEPIDDIRASNPPTNPPLLEYLEREFIESGFDVRHVMRLICQSRTYQLSVASNEFNEDDEVNYSRALPRRLPAEVLYDAIHKVTGAVSDLPGMPAGSRAVQLPGPAVETSDDFLLKFGRPSRESSCECERTGNLEMGPVMALVSGPTISSAIGAPDNAIATLAAEIEDDHRLIDELFVRILNRPASEQEIELALETLESIEEDHQYLVAAMEAREAEVAPIRQQLEGARQQAIAAARAELEPYEQKVAPEREQLKQQRQERIAKAEADLQEYEEALDEQFRAWQESVAGEVRWETIEPITMTSSNGATLEREQDGAIFVTGEQGQTVYTITAEIPAEGVTALRLEALADERLPGNGPGRAGNGNFVLTELELATASKAQPDESTRVGLTAARATFSQNTYDVATAIDGDQPDQNNGWAIVPETGKDHVAVFELADPLLPPDHEKPESENGQRLLTISLSQQYFDGQHALGRFRLSLTSASPPIPFQLPEEIQAILAVADDERTEEQESKLSQYYRENDPGFQQRQAALEQAQEPIPADPKLEELREKLAEAEQPVPEDPQLAQLRRDVEFSERQLTEKRLTAAQDVTWALINTPAFLFNH